MYLNSCGCKSVTSTRNALPSRKGSTTRNMCLTVGLATPTHLDIAPRKWSRQQTIRVHAALRSHCYQELVNVITVIT